MGPLSAPPATPASARFTDAKGGWLASVLHPREVGGNVRGNSGAVHLLSAPPSVSPSPRRHVFSALALAGWLIPVSAVCGESSGPVAPGQDAIASVAAAVRITGSRCDHPSELRYDAAASQPDRPAWIIRCEEGLFRVLFEGDTGPRVTPLGQ